MVLEPNQEGRLPQLESSRPADFHNLQDVRGRCSTLIIYFSKLLI